MLDIKYIMKVGELMDSWNPSLGPASLPKCKHGCQDFENCLDCRREREIINDQLRGLSNEYWESRGQRDLDYLLYRAFRLGMKYQEQQKELKMSNKSELPKYQSHKVVQAGKIEDISFQEDGTARVIPENKKYAELSTQPKYDERFKGDEDDLGYYVRYEDGYESWSPSKAFEEGYSMVQ